MILAIDSGNSAMKGVIFDQEGVLQSKVLNKLTVNKVKTIIEESKIDRLLISDSGNKTKELIELASEVHLKYLVISAQSELPIKLDYQKGQLGADRISAILGTCQKDFKQSALCVTFGTCITYNCIQFDASTKDYIFVGGAITPGKTLRAKSMHHFTSALPLVEVENNEEVTFPAKHTLGNLKSGILIGIQLEVEGFYNLFNAQYPDSKLVYTGGYAHQIALLTKNMNPLVDDYLLFNGLYRFLQFNKDE
jgi:type III pantothenate kinase